MKKMTKKTKSTRIRFCRIRFCNMTLAWSLGLWRDKAD